MSELPVQPLSSEQSQWLQELHVRFSAALSDAPGSTQLEHAIDTGDTKPFPV